MTINMLLTKTPPYGSFDGMNASRFDDDEPIAPVTNINSAFPGAAAHRSPDLVEGIEPYRLRLRRRLAKLGGAAHPPDASRSGGGRTKPGPLSCPVFSNTRFLEPFAWNGYDRRG